MPRRKGPPISRESNMGVSSSFSDEFTIPIIDPGDVPDDKLAVKSYARVREKDKPVRIRAGCDINSTHVDGKYLGKEWREVDHICKGNGSKLGWAHLADDSGWVSLDYVELLGVDLAQSK